MESIAQKIAKIKENIENAHRQAGRDDALPKLVVVTKSAYIEQIQEAIKAGAADLGESRAQRLGEVCPAIREFLLNSPVFSTGDIRWHMIGHLQRNKVRKVVGQVCCIHSVDTLRLAEEINTVGKKLNIRQQVMLQVNVSNEPQKYGIPVGAAEHLAEQMQTMENIKLAGLMTMAPLTNDHERVRSCFRRAREVFMEIKAARVTGPEFTELNMGMSQDYEIAVQEGATMVRVGSAIFA